MVLSCSNHHKTWQWQTYELSDTTNKVLHTQNVTQSKSLLGSTTSVLYCAILVCYILPSCWFNHQLLSCAGNFSDMARTFYHVFTYAHHSHRSKAFSSICLWFCLSAQLGIWNDLRISYKRYDFGVMTFWLQNHTACRKVTACLLYTSPSPRD